MRPTRLPSHLVVLALGTCFPLAAYAALPAITRELAWLIGLGLLCALSVGALVVARRRIRKITAENEALAAAAKAARTREKASRDADRAKDEFIAMLGHELRNPLAALAAATQVLNKLGAGGGMAGEAVAVVARQVAHMTRLVEDLLDVSRVTRGKVSLTREPLDLAALVGKTISEMRAAGRLDRHEVRLDLAPVWVRADGERVAQIISNLVGNAIKYTPAAGRVGISLRRDRHSAVLRVRDSGMGMTPELAARVFDLFVQGEGSDEGGVGGLGIGLTLVKHLAELQGGKAFAASAGPGAGSVFTVTLPAIDVPSATPAPEVQATQRRRYTILLIEDNEDARRALAAALELDGHRVHQAADGSAGIQALASVHPDVAVVDIGLPGLDGYHVARTVRGTADHAGTVLIALTGYGQPDSLRRAREAGFDEYVTKPITPERLMRLVEVAFATRAARVPSAQSQ